VTIAFVVFVMATCGILLFFTLTGGRTARVEARIDELAGRRLPTAESSSVKNLASTALPKVGTAILPADDVERTLLKTRLINAGYYGRQAMPIYLGIKLLLMTMPAAIGIVIGSLGLVPLGPAALVGACTGIFGMVAPSFYLDSKKNRRQTVFRRSLPDALDVLVICLEGGLSLSGSLKRVSSELRGAHPVLATELNIVQREILLGRTAGEALHQMGVRSGLDEVRNLASVITQSEKFGASLVKSLRVHADTLRSKRQQRAEEMAQKAATKILFPTLLFIFPALFVVLLGPAFFQIVDVMGNVGK
jgi:tight adherence protein C